MKTLQQNDLRVEQYLIPRLARLRKLIALLVTDPRNPQGVRFPIDSMLLALLAGLLAGCVGLRDVERQSQRLGLGRRGGKISDTALTSLLKLFDDKLLLPLQVAMVQDMKRRGQLQSEGLRLNWTTIDGKYSTLDHDADGMAQKFEDKENKSIYWRLGVLRAVLVSAPGRPALGQWHMGPVEGSETNSDKVKYTGEMTNLPLFVAWLREQYGELTSNFTLDAGLWSREVFAKMDQQALGVFGNLKENKPELYAEAARVLRIEQGRRAPDAQSDWEPCRNGQIQRRLWRTFKLEGWNGWTHLRQVLVVEQTTRRRDGGPDDVELRYFATNLPQATMTPKQLLELVRRHWAIENDCNWTLDVVMAEDDGAWCTQRRSMLALGVLRMIAYNMLQWLRKSHVKVRHKRIDDTPLPWRELHEMVFAVWIRIGDALLARLRPRTPT
jgi:predicted transposase YbfD/YdcC